MKHVILLLPLGLLGLTGCILAPQAAPVLPPSHDAPAAPEAPPPVRADQITVENAQKMSQALAQELERDAQRDTTPPPALPK